MTQQYQLTRDPDPQEALDAHVGGHLAELHTGCPGRIEKVHDNGLVDLMPLITRRYIVDNAEGDIVEEIQEYPVIPNCPVAWPRGGGFVFTFPIAKGDGCWMMFSERSLDKYLDSDGASVIDPEDARHHHLTDAVCWPGMTTAMNPAATRSTSNVVLAKEDNSVHLQITPGGEIQMKATAVRLGADGANKALALATETKARLDQIQGAFDLHMHPTAALGPPSPPVTPIGALGGIASTKVFTDA